MAAAFTICAALQFQNAELDADIALIVGCCVGDEIDPQIEGGPRWPYRMRCCWTAALSGASWAQKRRRLMPLPFPCSRQVSRNPMPRSDATPLKRQAQVIVLVTADSDFIPAMKFARREGAQLFLITLAHGIKVGMREHADLVIDQYPF